MPGGSSLGAIPELREEFPDTQIVVLTMQDDPAFAREAMRAGALGYVLKEAADDRARRGVRAPPGRHLPQPAARCPHGGRAGRAGGPRGDLSDREIEVLRLIALGHTNSEIAQQLFLSVRTVESHRAHIQQKLGLSTRAELVRYALEHKLIEALGRLDVVVLAAGGQRDGTSPRASARCPVFFLGSALDGAAPFLWGSAAGTMGVASVVGLLLPAARRGRCAPRCRRRSPRASLFLLGCGGSSAGHEPHVASSRRRSAPVGCSCSRASRAQPAGGLRDRNGLRVGDRGPALFIILAIALQNMPEGTSVAIPMAERRLRPHAAVLGGGAHERAAAGRRGRRISRRGGDQRPAAGLVRVRGRRDAGAGGR